MSCEMAALSFQAHANYGTWSIDFGFYQVLRLRKGKEVSFQNETWTYENF